MYILVAVIIILIHFLINNNKVYNIDKIQLLNIEQIDISNNLIFKLSYYTELFLLIRAL